MSEALLESMCQGLKKAAVQFVVREEKKQEKNESLPARESVGSLPLGIVRTWLTCGLRMV